MKLVTNARQLARRFGQRASKIANAWQRGLRRVAAQGEAELQKRLSGPADGDPGSYPVPNRTGNLFRSAGARPQGRDAVVLYNTAPYAVRINADPRQPFADEAAAAVQQKAPKIMAVSLREVWR